MMPQGKYIALLLCLLLVSCSRFDKKINWQVSLDKDDKKPYGAYLGYQSLKLWFPSHKIVDLSPGFRYSNIDNRMMETKDGRSMLLAVGLDFYLTQREVTQLIRFAEQGNELVVFARNIDSKLEEQLRLSMQHNGYEEMPLTELNNGRVNLHALRIRGSNDSFGYMGRSLQGSFQVNTDTMEAQDDSTLADEEEQFSEEELLVGSQPDTLGFATGMPNIVRYKVGEGHIILHAAPLVMSNYFLLQKDNRKYLEQLWTYLPQDIQKIYWNDYYKRNTKASDLSVLLQYPATRWAFFIALLILLIYALFESKRRQRIIPEIAPLENSSVSFVETVARLYFNKGDHRNLAEKMVQHFLEWIRTHYFIATTSLDAGFERQLIVRSGLPDATVRSLLELIREVQLNQRTIDEADLYHLHNIIQQFYKSHRS